jgi:hypothetical protein
VRVRAGTIRKERRALWMRVRLGTVHKGRVRAGTVRRGRVRLGTVRKGSRRTLWVRVRAGTVYRGSRTSLWTSFVLLATKRSPL